MDSGVLRVSLFDQHVHTRFSPDSRAEPAGCVRAAAGLGLAGLAFTDHCDLHPAERPGSRYDFDALRAEVDRLRARWGPRLFIGHGIEICWLKDQQDGILEALEGRQLDVVLLSVHWAGGRAIWEPDSWLDWEPAAAAEDCLMAVRDAVRWAARLRRAGLRPFDVLGHLDIVRRYAARFGKACDLRPFGLLIDEILQGCLEAGIVPELNTSTMRGPPGDPMPQDWIVRRYLELGGRALTLGSDAHTVDDVGAHLAAGADILRRLGVRHQAVFIARQLRLEAL